VLCRWRLCWCGEILYSSVSSSFPSHPREVGFFLSRCWKWIRWTIDTELLGRFRIIKDSTNAAFFTNRALVRLRMDMFDQVIDDCLKAIDLVPSSRMTTLEWTPCVETSHLTNRDNVVKAYSYLGQAQLKLGYPNEALSSTLRAYELAIAQRSPSVGTIATTCLEVKKKRWELSEERRRARECNLLKQMTQIIERDAEREVDLILRSPTWDPVGSGRDYSGSQTQDKIDDVRSTAREKIQTLEDVFGKAEAERCGKREVPDYLIDNITFSVMLDPVIVRPEFPPHPFFQDINTDAD